MLFFDAKKREERRGRLTTKEDGKERGEGRDG